MKPAAYKHRGYGRKLLIFLFSLFMFTGAGSFPASADVTGWEITPANPAVGDSIRIRGTASPEEEVSILVFYEKEVPVLGGRYSYELQNVEIPDFNNRFTLRAEGVKDLNVKGKLIFWTARSSQASEGAAVISEERVPPGAYQLLIDGQAEANRSAVKLKIAGMQLTKADSDGEFSYVYGTESVPPGNFEIKAGDYTASVTLRPGESPAPETAGAAPLKGSLNSRSVIVPEDEDGAEKNSQTTGSAHEKSSSPEEKLSSGPGQPPGLKTAASDLENTGQSGLFAYGIYLFGGIGAGLLFIFAYSKI